MTKNNILLFLCVLVAPAVKAQVQGNPLDEKYVPKKNAIFGSTDKDVDRNEESSSGEEYKHVVKFVPTSLVRNIFALQYEYLFNDQVSATATVGFCYNRDRIQQLTSDVFDGSNNGASNAVSFNYMMTNSEFGGGISPLLGLGMRFYYTSYYGNNDYFFEINFKSYANNLTMKSATSPEWSTPYYVSGTRDFKVSNRSINLVYGVQYVLGDKVLTTHDLYFSVGLNFLKYDAFLMQQYDGVNGSYQQLVRSGEETRMTPVVNIGYAFGFCFGKK